VPSHLAATRQAADDADDDDPIDTDEEIDAQAQEIAQQADAIDDDKKDFAAEVNTVVSHLDISTLSTELNPTRIYTGTATAALLEAASTWNGLARDLNATAHTFEAILALFRPRPVAGQAVTATAAASPPPELGWLTGVADQTELAATRTRTDSQPFETAFVTNLSPSRIAADRATLVALTSVNLVRGNIPAMVATGALYVEMWAQDVSAFGQYPT
jgi:PPE-repeat protein